MENVNKDFKKRGISLIILMVAALILCPVACNRSNVKELPTGQEYVNKNGDGSLTVESAHKIRLWDGHGLPNTFTIKNSITNMATMSAKFRNAVNTFIFIQAISMWKALTGVNMNHMKAILKGISIFNSPVSDYGKGHPGFQN